MPGAFKEERLRSDYKGKSKGKIEVPAKEGNYGIPSGMPGVGNKGPKFDTPVTKGDKGKTLPKRPSSKGAPRD